MEAVITVAELLRHRHRSPLSSHVPSHRHRSQTPPPPPPPPLPPSSSSPSSSSSSSAAAAASALSSALSSQPSSSKVSLKRKLTQENQTPLSKENLLDLLENSSVLVGRIQLWNCSFYSSSQCSYLDCLAFSDDSDTICCVLREINPQILGKLVRINSWSFIPKRGERGRKVKDKENKEEKGKARGGGCLEVRDFEIMEEMCSSRQSIYLNHELASLPNIVMETPPTKQYKSTGKNRIGVAGCVTFIGPPFAIPYGEIRGINSASPKVEMMNGSNVSDQCFTNMASLKGTTEDQRNKGADASKVYNAPLLSFLVGLTACNHTPSCITSGGCTLSATNCTNPKNLTNQVAYIYFSGSPAAWRPILLALSGRCVSISGLRRKILVTGKDRTQYSTYAATRSSFISSLSMDLAVNMQRSDKNSCSREHKLQQNVCQGKGLISYIGVVTDMFMKGRLLELDGCIWLLLIHQPLSQVHGLRVGATVAAHYVHFLRLRSCFECSFLMASCSISHVVVTRFSPFKTLYAEKWCLQSTLGRFIESLSFLSAFRAVQIIISLKLKFESFNSGREMFCSTKSRSIAENYIRSIFSFGTSQFRDVLTEFFSHRISCRLSRSDYDHFTLQVPPINNFCKQIRVMCCEENSFVWKQEKRSFQRKISSTEVQDNFIRRVVSSDMLGIALLGFLQFSQVTGRLQLFDSTGAIDVVIPDLETAQCFQEACQVTVYDLVIEGYVKPSTSENARPNHFPMAWNNIFKGSGGDIEVFTSVSFFLIFQIKDVYFMQHMKHIKLSRSCHQEGQIADNDRSYACNFYMFLVLHKYPVRIKSSDKLTEEASISFCLEAIRIPYTLCILHQLKDCKEMHDLQGCSVLCSVSRLCQLKQRSTVPGMLKRAVDQKEHTGAYGYIHSDAILKKEETSSRPTFRRVLLQFRNRDIEFHEGIKIGQYYLMDSFPASVVVTLNTRSRFLSVMVEYTSEVQMPPSETAKLPLFDIILRVPLPFKQGFNSVLEDARKHLSPVLSVGELLNQRICQGAILYNNQENLEQSGLSKGSLISFIGMIERIQPFTFVNGGRLTRTNQTNSCKLVLVKDLDNSCLVKVKFDPDHDFLPPGFGPTAVVSLHRALLQLSSDGEMILKCISSTLVVVNSISVDSYMKVDEMLTLHKATVPTRKMEIHSVECTKIDSMLRSDCNISLPKLLKLRCKVVSIEWIVLEKKNLDNISVHSDSTGHQSINYRVSYMFFSIDDGSGVTKCWAKDDVAAGLLNLPVRIDLSLENSISSESIINARHLNLLLKKYGMIIVHGHCFSNDRIVFHVGEAQTLDVEEHKFLYALVRTACHQGPMEIIAECCEPGTSSISLKGWSNNTDMPLLQAKTVNTMSSEIYLSVICEELSETLKTR